MPEPNAKDPIIAAKDSPYGNGPKSQAQSFEGSTEFVSSLQSQLEQRHIILKRVSVLPAGTKVLESKRETKPTTKVRQW